MDEYTLPPEPDEQWAQRVRESWPATVAALPLGTAVSGEVVGRQPFGGFIQLAGLPDAVGLAEITAVPLGTDLPRLGASVIGRVIWHTSHLYQVKVRLSGWAAQLGASS